jgi:hypothetical protein
MGNWRWATWLIVGWTVLMVVLMVVWIYPEVPNTESYNPPPGDDTAAYQAGVAFGVALIYWVIGMIVLGPIWYFTRKRLLCPVCGNKVGANARMCGRCGYVPGMAFPQGAYPAQQYGWPSQQQGWPPQQPPQPGWPPQAQQPGWPPQAQPPQAGWPPQAQQSGWPPQQPPQQPGWPPQQPPQSPQSGWPPPPPPPTSGE